MGESINEFSKVKIGARMLNLNELKAIIPTYEDIFEQIKEIRNSAKAHHKQFQNYFNNPANTTLDSEFDKHYNYVFSVLGERGAGKTSILLTLRQKLLEINRSGKCEDIYLPIIVPEDMDNSSDVLGWLIGFFEPLVKGLEDKIFNNIKRQGSVNYNSQFKLCDYKGENGVANVVRSKYDELQKSYLLRTKDFRDIIKDNYSGISDYIKSNRNILDFDQKLMKNFQLFLDSLLDCYRSFSNEDEPLIFLFFDDVDMNTNRCFEVLNIITRFLSLPNMVVFTAGEYNTFLEALTINFLQRENLLGNAMKENFSMEVKENKKIVKTAIEQRKRMAQDYLLKILPPTLRYYIPKYSNKMKAEFSYISIEELLQGKDDVVSNSLDESEKIKTNERTLYNLLIKSFELGENKDDNFLNYNGAIIFSYFKIFPESPRGLLNIYYFLNSMLHKIQGDGKKDIKEVWNKDALRQFLSVIINSSKSLTKYESEISEFIKIRDRHFWVSANEVNSNSNKYDDYIDYSYLISLFQKLNAESTHKNNFLTEEFITLFILGHFFENILKVIYKDRERVHGSKVLIKLLNGAQSDIIIYPYMGRDTKASLKLYDMMCEKRIEAVEKNANDYYLMKHYFQVISKFATFMKNKDIHSFFQKMINLDERWTNEKLDIIMSYGSLANRSIMEVFKNTYEKLKYISYENWFLTRYKNIIDDFYKKVNKYNRLDLENPKGNDIELEIKRQLEKYIKEISYYDYNKKDEYIKSVVNNAFELMKQLQQLIEKYEKLNSMKGNIVQPKNKDKDEINNLIIVLSREIRQLNIRLNDSRSKTLWEWYLKNKSIVKISFLEKKMTTNKASEEAIGDETEYKVEFNPNDVKLLIKYKDIFGNIVIKKKGILQIKEFLTEAVREAIVNYFEDLETMDLFKLLINELNAMLLKIDRYEQYESFCNENGKTNIAEKINEYSDRIIKSLKDIGYHVNLTCDLDKNIKDGFREFYNEYKKLCNFYIDIQIKSLLPADSSAINIDYEEKLNLIFDKILSDTAHIYNNFKGIRIKKYEEFRKNMNSIKNIKNPTVMKLVDRIISKTAQGTISKQFWEDFKRELLSPLSLEANKTIIENSEFGSYEYLKFYLNNIESNYFDELYSIDMPIDLQEMLYKLDRIFYVYIKASVLFSIYHKTSYNIYDTINNIKTTLIECSRKRIKDGSKDEFDDLIDFKLKDSLKVTFND